MKYKLTLCFYVKKEDKERILKFIEKAMYAFHEIFPDAVHDYKLFDEPFATLSWDENSPSDITGVGKVGIDGP